MVRVDATLSAQESSATTLPVVLTVAGSDSSGGAGIQADLKTFAALRCFGTSAITALTAQNTTGVTAVAPCPPDVVRAQIDAVLADLPVVAAKTGMLVDKATIDAVAAALSTPAFPLVVDPVILSKSGHALLADDAVDALLARLLPRAAVVTPNRPEAARLTGVDLGAQASDDDVVRAGRALLARGARAALVKGGHADGDVVVDVLVLPDGVRRVSSTRLATRHTHGTGCTLSAALACLLGRGTPLPDAVEQAIAYVHEGIAQAPGLGHGHGPLHHLHPFYASRPPAAATQAAATTSTATSRSMSTTTTP
jgi:hydroxymethylpyrimidine/phosphomethylpyrimidine kinase